MKVTFLTQLRETMKERDSWTRTGWKLDWWRDRSNGGQQICNGDSGQEKKTAAADATAAAANAAAAGAVLTTHYYQLT